MSPNQTKALKAMAEAYSNSPEFSYMSFSKIALRSGLAPDLIRRTVRAVARKGFAEYQSGLWSDDGEPRGAGYRITNAGMKALEDAQ